MLPTSFKFLSGVEQIQLMVELIFGLKYEIKMIKYAQRHEIHQKQEMIERVI